MEIRSFEPRLDEAAAVGRTERLTVPTYLRSKLRGLLGRSPEPESITRLYYPDYIAYTTVEFDRLARGEKTVKFLAAVDAVTGRVGEVDLELPERETLEVPDGRVLPIEVPEEGATEAWREWLFPYLDRSYRPVRRPESTLDRLELVYTPFLIVDYGEEGERYAVSTLTKQVELLEDVEALEAGYDPA
ncbi:hypothetical protein [Halalkalicoccus tibetensis]|uniref:Halobacterial output domain-containing protein n=1 Tax=Halalkalicoccus tibetensis TaxID=175632 RepID=A0ABD5V2D5_9EURY